MLEKESQEYYFKNLEEKSHKGDSLVVEGILGLVAVAREAMKNPEYEMLVLTECDKCCSEGASYRLFSGVPNFGKGNLLVQNQHPDTSGRNLDIMIAKCYSETPGMAERIAMVISPDARRLTVEDNVPAASIVYVVKE